MTDNLTPRQQELLKRYVEEYRTPKADSPAEEEAAVVPVSLPASDATFTIDAILRGETKENSNMAIALREALDCAGQKGIVPNMPEFIAAKANAPDSHNFWQQWYSVHTEENIGIDTKGLFYAKGTPVLVISHGGALLPPDRIQKALTDKNGMIDGSARYQAAEFQDLLERNVVPDFYKYEELSKYSSFPHRFNVVMPYKTAQATQSGQYTKADFTKNPLVLARTAGSWDHLEEYFDRASRQGQLGNYHCYANRKASVPQGRVLFVDDDIGGLDGGDDLNYGGRFVGVEAPEAHAAPKR